MTFKVQVSCQRDETWLVFLIALAIYCGKAYSIHDSLKTMAGGHAVQAILWTTVDLSIHFVRRTRRS